MLTKLKSNIIYLGYSIKKELIIFLFINIILIGLAVFLFILRINMIINIVTLMFIPLIDYLFLSRYQNLINKLKEERNVEFITLLSYFEIFISNHNNVYKSLSLLKQYSSDWMEERLSNLLNEIDNDKSVAPYINFSKNFTYSGLQNVMISIYQMVEEGESRDALLQFDYMFNSISETIYQNKLTLKEKSIDSLNAFPLIGAGVITILLTLSVMAVIGDIINVI